MRRDYDGRRVVVTGAAGALGSAVVRLLVERGATCHLVDRTAPRALPPGSDAARIQVHEGVDLTDEAAVVRLYGGLGVPWASIHCAGGFDMTAIAETTLDAWESMWRINAVTAFLCSRESARAMLGGGAGGRIVNIAARPALEPRTGAGMTAYTASKAAVAAFTRALGEELAQSSIWVNAVAPSILDTEANRRAMPDADFSRWATPESVAGLIAFLASPDNRATRAAVIPVYARV